MTKIWFITGASSGFGRLWAQAALRRGDAVIAAARRLDALAPLTDEFGERLLAMPLDVTDREAVFEAVEKGVERFGRIDVVVNNAGYGQWGMVEELTERELREQMETNFFGATWVAQAVLPVLRAQGSGHLIQVTSEGGVRAFPGIGAYHASKWAVEGLTESLAQEVAGFGIAVTALEPGPYATGFGGSIRSSAQMAEYAPFRASSQAEFRLGDPAATVDPVLQLVDSDDPPRRLILGEVVSGILDVYEQRVRTWRNWQDVSVRAFGHPET
jgi:NAD(P)-dependent dehydrogenase (short-subunit alcohol dehydrogenase family)